MGLRHHRSLCPIAQTLDLVGDRWTLLVVRDLFEGKARYRDFLASPERIATNVLADRLHRLVETGLVATAPCPERSGSHLYFLTELGRGLEPLLAAARSYGALHVSPNGGPNGGPATPLATAPSPAGPGLAVGGR